MLPQASFEVFQAGQLRLVDGLRPIKLRVRQAEFAHDIAMVQIPGEQANLLRYQTGQPMRLRWGWGGLQATFVGYMHHIVPEETIGQARQPWVVCSGASWPLRETGFRSYEGAQAEQVVAMIATEHRLSSLVTTTPVALPQVVQAGKSDWDLLCDLAQRVGRTLYCRRTDLRLVPRTMRRDRVDGIFTPQQAVTAVREVRDALYQWVPLLGETVPGEDKAWWESHGLDVGGEPVGAVSAPLGQVGGTTTTSPLFTRLDQPRPVHTMAEAAEVARGAAEQRRHYQTGTADVSGAPLVAQGSTVLLRGLNRESNGLWYVISAEHHLTWNGAYHTALRVGRDSIGDGAPRTPPGIADPQPFHQTKYRQVVYDGATPVDQRSMVDVAPQSVLRTPGKAIPFPDLPATADRRPEALRNGKAQIHLWQAAQAVSRTDYVPAGNRR